jgi:hypothetical protein
MIIQGYTKALLASGARAASSSSAIDFGITPDVASFFVSCTTRSGTSPTLDVYLQHSIDNGASYIDFAHFAQITAAGVYEVSWAAFSNATNNTANVATVTTGDAVLAADRVINGQICAKYFRLKWVIGGTNPSFTFRVDALCKSEV